MANEWTAVVFAAFRRNVSIARSGSESAGARRNSGRSCTLDAMDARQHQPAVQVPFA